MTNSPSPAMLSKEELERCIRAVSFTLASHAAGEALRAHITALESQATRAENARVDPDIEGLVGRLEAYAADIESLGDADEPATFIREASSAIRAMAANIETLRESLQSVCDDEVDALVELSSLKREVRETVGPMAECSSDFDPANCPDDRVVPLFSFTYGDLRALSALHDKMGAE